MPKGVEQPDVLDWQRVTDQRATARHVVRALRAGRLALFPTESGYGLAASGLAADAVERLRAAADAGAAPPAVAVRGPGPARDWAPGLGPIGRRLTRRLWPGPLALEAAAEGGLARRLPEPVRRALCPSGTLRLRTPAHAAVQQVLARLDGPLLLADLPPVENGVGPGELAGAVGGVDLVLAAGPWRPGPGVTVVRCHGDDWELVAEGAVSAEELRRQSACLVVFLCTGNTCRSPLAEALCKRRLAERLRCAVADLPAHGFCVVSAGLAAYPGAGAAEEAVAVARAYGADLDGHRSRPLTADLAAQADHLLAMTHSHLQALVEHFPRLAARPGLLSPDGDDIADPIGHDQSVYEACSRAIWDSLDVLVERLLPAAQAAAPEDRGQRTEDRGQQDGI
jgi:protein-tyrosine phosphatase